MKGVSEGNFRAALSKVDLSLVIYKPPDDARLWKPCDYMVWQPDGAGGNEGWWFEVKDLDDKHVNTFPLSELRPSQLQGIRDAARVGIPYWIAIWWRRHRSWTVSDAHKITGWWRDEIAVNTDPIRKPKSIDRTLLMSRFGLESTQAQLSSNLKMVLLGEA